MSNTSNILFICCDQLRRDALGVNGSAVCQTTHLDLLAAEGMNFSRAFTVSALCSPARASLLPGLYPPRHGLPPRERVRRRRRNGAALLITRRRDGAALLLLVLRHRDRLSRYVLRFGPRRRRAHERRRRCRRRRGGRTLALG